MQDIYTLLTCVIHSPNYQKFSYKNNIQVFTLNQQKSLKKGMTVEKLDNFGLRILLLIRLYVLKEFGTYWVSTLCFYEYQELSVQRELTTF